MFKQIESTKVNFQIMGQIKESIMNGKLGRGDRLPSERVMAEQLGVSRATVREAIRSMELMGLVKCVQGEGNFIPESLDNSLIEPLSLMFMLNRSKVHEIGELRRALEIEAVRLAVGRIDRDVLDRMACIVNRIESSEDEEERVESDKAFHREIANASGNLLIINILSALSQIITDQITDVRKKIVSNEEDFYEVDRQHRNILNAISEKNTEDAIAAMSEHMGYVNQHL